MLECGACLNPKEKVNKSSKNKNTKGKEESHKDRLSLVNQKHNKNSESCGKSKFYK